MVASYSPAEYSNCCNTISTIAAKQQAPSLSPIEEGFI